MNRAEGGLVRGDRIADLALLPENWDSYGASPITGPALAVLRNLSAVPMKDGGIQIEWHCNGWDVEIEVDRDGVPVSFYQERSKR